MGAIADRAALSKLAAVASPTPIDTLGKELLAELQAALAMLGYPVGDIDGLIGPKTRNAWAEYKADIFPGNPLLIGAESIDRLRQDLSKLAAWEAANFSNRQGTIDAIKGMCQAMGIGLPTQVAYVLATTQWESAQTFKPVKEAFWLDEEWRRANLHYFPYYGRGYVQLTWEKNYKAYSDILGIDLVSDPDRAMDAGVALFVLVHGFKTGTFTGRKIADFINQHATDFLGARRCINGTDRANEIADLAKAFLPTIGPATGPAPVVVAAPPVAPVAPVVVAPIAAVVEPPAVALDSTIEKLSLRPVARAAAYELKRLHPQVVFTSGRRDKVAQARAMAENSVGQRNWISLTYRANKASQSLQQWVLDNPQATTAPEIAAGLLATMNALTDGELGELSRHLSGDAFDIQPMEPDHANIKRSIRTLAGLRNFLDREGGLVRWHAEFDAEGPAILRHSGRDQLVNDRALVRPVLNEAQLRAMMPNAGNRLTPHLPFIEPVLVWGNITTPARIAAFMAQLAHESGEYQFMEEIADGTAYEGRADLGNTQAGDGVKFKGHGPIQITGRNNHRDCGNALGLDLIANPRLICEPEHGTKAAAWFWNVKRLSPLADAGWYVTITRRINGGETHLAERIRYWDDNRRLLGLPRIDTAGEDAAIRAFQRQHGLEDDGIAGNMTIDALERAAMATA